MVGYSAPMFGPSTPPLNHRKEWDFRRHESRCILTRNGIGPIVGRIFGIVAGLLVAGLVLKLIAVMLAGVLPVQLYQALSAGWNLLYGLLGPAIAPITALVIIAALIWVVLGRRR